MIKEHLSLSFVALEAVSAGSEDPSKTRLENYSSSRRREALNSMSLSSLRVSGSQCGSITFADFSPIIIFKGNNISSLKPKLK